MVYIVYAWMPTVIKRSTLHSHGTCLKRWAIMKRLQQSSNQIPLLYFLSLTLKQTRDIFLQMYDTDHQHHCMHAGHSFSRSLPLPLTLRHSHALAHTGTLKKQTHRSTHSHDSITSLSFLLSSSVSYLSNKLENKVRENSSGLEMKNASDVSKLSG